MARGSAAASTSLSLVVAVLLSSFCVARCSSFNITQVLAAYPDFTQFNDWLSKTGVAEEINNRSTLTVLAPSNAVLGGYLSGVSNAWTNPEKIGDTLRYHVLLGYFGMEQLKEVPTNGSSVTTLLQTTGRANQSQGFVTIYNNGSTYLVGHEFVDSFGNETVMNNVTQLPYLYSILQVSALLTPVPPAPPAPAPAKPPLGSVPVTAPAAPTVPADGPAGSESTTADDNHGTGKSVSMLLALLAMLFAFSFAWI